jgi:hypothetical protein
MSLNRLAQVLRPSLPPGALCSLFGPRTCTGRSRSCATASLTARRRLINRVLEWSAARRKKARLKWYVHCRLEGRSVLLHRLIMSLWLGRRLRTLEHVHHRDGDRHNNALENLELLSARAHAILTRCKYPLVQFCALCDKPFLGTRKGSQRPHYCSRRCGARARQGWTAKNLRHRLGLLAKLAHRRKPSLRLIPLADREPRARPRPAPKPAPEPEPEPVCPRCGGTGQMRHPRLGTPSCPSETVRCVQCRD